MKKLSRNEMKNVMGGYKLINGCMVDCCVHVSGGVCAEWIHVTIETCNDIPFGCNTMGENTCSCANPS